MTKKYLYAESVEDFHSRLKNRNYEKLKAKAIQENKSLNYLLNEMIEKNLNVKKEEYNFDTEKTNLSYNFNEKIKIYNNDFIDADFKKYYNKVGLIVTSPPYNLDIEYNSHNDAMNYEKYINRFTKLWLKKAYKLLENGGRLCLNIPLDKNKGGLRSVYADITEIAQEVGFGYQSTIVWNEQNISRRVAWGSWLSASAPYVIAPVEMIVLLYKGQWKKNRKGKTDIIKKEFMDWTNGVWTFPGEKKTRVGHPAPFPEELPRRCIKLFSYKDDLILDPFLGSGTTLVAANKLNRKAIGVELDQEYVDLSQQRVEESINLFSENIK